MHDMHCASSPKLWVYFDPWVQSDELACGLLVLAAAEMGMVRASGRYCRSSLDLACIASFMRLVVKAFSVPVMHGYARNGS